MVGAFESGLEEVEVELVGLVLEALLEAVLGDVVCAGVDEDEDEEGSVGFCEEEGLDDEGVVVF